MIIHKDLSNLLLNYINLYSLLYLTLISSIECIDICGNHTDIDLSHLNHATLWNLTHFDPNHIRYDFQFSFCTPLKYADTSPLSKCNGKFACEFSNGKVNGYEPSSVVDLNSLKRVYFEGPKCNEMEGTNYTLNIHFSCGVNLGSPEYFYRHKCSTTLLWRSSAACKAKPSQNEVMCYVYDNDGLKRDLTPLIKPKSGYYRVLSAYTDEDFYLNVCSDASSICPGDSSGACRKDISNNKMESVGDHRWYSISFNGNSAAVPYDHIVLTYSTRTSKCRFNNEDSVFKTIVRFRCPSYFEKSNIDSIDRNPKLISNLDCIYEIEWLTEYACPVNALEAPANTCEFKEYIHGLDLNLKSLLKTTDDYKIDDVPVYDNKTMYEITFNVCGGLNDNKCGDNQWKTNSVCLKTKDGKMSRVIGSVKGGKLIAADGRILLNYPSQGNACSFEGNMIQESTIIEFVCDESLKDNGKPEYVLYEDCNYFIRWKTPLVCRKSLDDSCTVRIDNDTTIDLSPLTKSFKDRPWIADVAYDSPWARHAKSTNDIIYLNICDKLPRNVNTSKCDPTAAACLFATKTNTTINLGKFVSPPKFNADTKAVELYYDNGYDDVQHKKVSTKISLRCNPGSIDTSPVLTDFDETEDIYEFEWKTSAACPLDIAYGNDCKVYDKFLDYTFDLTPLKTDDHYVINNGKYQFHINVCGAVNSSQCTSGVRNANSIGVCQIEKGTNRIWSLGMANSTLTYWNGVINVTHTNGTPYNDAGKTPRKSNIIFICHPNIGKGQPEFIGEANRSYVFRWYTSYACHDSVKTVHCVWDNGSHIIDLTPLALSQGNHFAIGKFNTRSESSPSIYYINICRPLNPVHNDQIKKCGSNSAVCKVTIGADSTVWNLGEAADPPIGAFDGSINLFYRNGSVCPDDNSKRISTRINFICDLNGDTGMPIVIEPGDEKVDGEKCVYLIEWKTAAVCAPINPQPMQMNECTFNDTRTGLTANLTALKRLVNQSPYEIFINRSKESISLNVCGSANPYASSVCTNAAVCFKNSNGEFLNYGLVTASSFFYDGRTLRLRYFNGTKCPHSDSGLSNSEIIFKCDPNADPKLNRPQLVQLHKCLAVFEWETNIICDLQLPSCSIVKDNHYYNLRQLSSVSHAWNATDESGNTYHINICNKLPSEIGCINSNAAVCKCNSRNECPDDLGESLIHDLSVEDNGNLLLTYKLGNNHDCKGDVRAESKIHFKCGNKTGKPRFVKSIIDDRECVFIFEWETFMACPVDQRNDRLKLSSNGYLYDKKINAYINITPLLSKTFNVTTDSRKDNYTYIINLNHVQSGTKDDCSNAAICQVKPNFMRDIGSLRSEEFYLMGHELQIIVHSTDEAKKCGKNKNKNVTSVIILQCSTSSGLGTPRFVYESNDCDYIFSWDTDVVCPTKFETHPPNNSIVPPPKGVPQGESRDDHKDTDSGGSHVWIGVIIVLCGISALLALFIINQRTRSSVMFRFRRFFAPSEVQNTTFHYHQLETRDNQREREAVAFINLRKQRSDSNAIASTNVPFNSIYDDSDVDLLT